MTPASPHRPHVHLPAAVAVLSLLLGLAGSRSSESLPASTRMLPLELARLFPHLTTTPEPLRPPLPAPAEVAPAVVPPPAASRLDPQVAERYLLSLPFGREIRRAAHQNRIDGLLVAAIVEAESSFRPDAVSEKGALGLMQLMPFHLEGVEEPLDPAVNLALGTGYLAELEARYGGDVRLTLAAYHAGPGAVARWGGIPPYASTRTYIGRVLALYEEHQRKLGVDGEALRLAAAEAPPTLQRGS